MREHEAYTAEDWADLVADLMKVDRSGCADCPHWEPAELEEALKLSSKLDAKTVIDLVARFGVVFDGGLPPIDIGKEQAMMVIDEIEDKPGLLAELRRLVAK